MSYGDPETRLTPTRNIQMPTTDYPIRFRYKNWKGVEYEYVIRPEMVEYGDYDIGGKTGDGTKNWVVHGQLVMRDGDPRPNMGTRRRTFLLDKIQPLPL